MSSLSVLLRTGKVPMMPVMSEDEIGEIKDELKAYKEQLDALRRDMEVVVKYSTSLRNV